MNPANPNHPRPGLIEEWINFLRRISIFSELDEESLKGVARKLQPLSLPKGTTIYSEGVAGDALYMIQSGRVRIVVRDDETGGEKVINYLGRGETFGETSLLTGAPRSVTAKVDSNCNFLVLYKQDFESFLRKNPTASFYLSRLLSRRLLAASHVLQEQMKPPELLGFFCDLEKEDHAVFILNLCLALVEQTRRRILLLELSPYGYQLVKSLGLEPLQTHASMLHASDLQNPAILERMTQHHPSGLEILTLPEEVFSGPLFQGIGSLLESLREMYDFVIVDTHGLKSSAGTGQGFENAVSRTFLQECDSVFHVYRAQPSRAEFIDSVAKEGKPVKRVVLGESGAALFNGADYRVPWTDQHAARFAAAGKPFLEGANGEATLRMLERLARAIGKVQVGLAMGSGAAYGYTIIGILKVFEREKIPVDFISGTSMGALLGSFYAAGRSAAEIDEIAQTITKVWLRRNFLADLNLPWPHGGILMGHTIARFLRSVLGEVDFKDLPTPFGCVATDIVTGDPVVLREGKVWEAVRASLSLPIIFRPYVHSDRFLVDGGLVNPVPTSVIASMGADVLISVNLTNKVSEKKVSLRKLGMFPAASPGIFNILFKMIYTMQYQVVSARTDLAHVMIRPDTRNYSWVDFHRAKQIIPFGEEAAEESLTKIKSRLPFFSDYCKVPQRRPR